MVNRGNEGVCVCLCVCIEQAQDCDEREEAGDARLDVNEQLAHEGVQGEAPERDLKQIAQDVGHLTPRAAERFRSVGVARVAAVCALIMID